MTQTIFFAAEQCRKCGVVPAPFVFKDYPYCKDCILGCERCTEHAALEYKGKYYCHQCYMDVRKHDRR